MECMYLSLICLIWLRAVLCFQQIHRPMRTSTPLHSKLFDGQPMELTSWNKANQERFMSHYWGKRPVCIRDAFTNFDCRLRPADLWKISKSEFADSRLISHSKESGWQQQFGPFPTQMFKQIRELRQQSGLLWTLLVNEVNLHRPEVQTWFQAFPTIPSWKFDDIMISYAVKGAGIGAHVDNYDVFLLQGKGKREWAIEDEFISTEDELSRKRTDVDIHLLKRFKPQISWELSAGDVLYLPPRIPHRGTALDDDCVTISFGIRNPHKDEMFGAFTTEMLQRHVKRELLPDAHLSSKTEMLSELHENVRQVIANEVGALTSNRTLFDNWLGKYITTPTRERAYSWPRKYKPNAKHDKYPHSTPKELIELMMRLTEEWPQLWHAAGVKFAHSLADSKPAIFANGESFHASGLKHETAVRLSQTYSLSPNLLQQLLKRNPKAHNIIEQLISRGYLTPVLQRANNSWGSDFRGD